MPSVTIRPGVPADLDAVREVFRRASLSNPGDREVLLTHPEVLVWDGEPLAAGRTQVAVTDEGLVVGFATTTERDGEWELDDLFVDPDRRRQGIATRLLSGLVGCVHVTANPHAAEFYASVGFVPDGQAPTRFGPAPRMRLDVPPVG